VNDQVSLLVNAIVLGSAYAVVALGIVLIFSVLDVMSIAQGQLLVAAAYVGFVTVLTATGNLLLAAVATILAGGVLGVIVERLAVRPAAAGGHMATLVTTLGAGIVITNALILVAGPYQRGVDTGSLADTAVRISGVPISWAQILTIVALAAGFATVQGVILRTGTGRVVRAAAENPVIAPVFGIDIGRVRTLTFAAGSALAGLAGVMLVTRYGYISPEFGLTFTLKGLTAVLLGGAGRLSGAAIAAFGLALVETAANTYIGADYGDLIAFALLFVLLVIRPEGLFAAAERRGG
jgi:branched-chain amino acid transport system permease protein